MRRPLGREVTVELPGAHGAFHRVAVQRCLKLDLPRVAVGTCALLGPGNRVAGDGGIVGIFATPRLVTDFEFVAVLPDC